MCNLVYLSTSSPEDLAALSGDLFRLRAPDESDDEEVLGLLAYPHRWYLESRYGGCSCSYRHLNDGSPMEFGLPEEWANEDQEDIESTWAVYDVLLRLIEEGHGVDVVDIWDGTSAEEVETLPVALGDVPREEFRFFEGYRFTLGP